MPETIRITSGQPVVDMPLDAVTQKFAILAVSGRGKTYTASVMAEEMIGAGQPIVVVDPTGAWWGLRSSADGKKAGLPVIIFGGKHADVPLEPTAGRVLADLVVNQTVSVVLDTSGFETKAEEIRFMTDFLTRLYRKNEEPVHVFVDEADEYAPQQAFPEGKRLLGAMEQIVRRGRLKGLGVTLITQRPAVLNKNVLSQIETLILLGMTGANDLQAIDTWVGKHARVGQAVDIKASLPGLEIGSAWIWSPAWLKVTKRVRIRKRTTFDSSATPKVGERRIEPKVMAKVDLDALGEQILATVEKAEAEDPKALRQKISRLERELELERSRPPVEAEPERISVPALDEDDRMVMVEMAQTLDKVLSAVEGGRPRENPSFTPPPPQRQRLPVPTPPPRPPSDGDSGSTLGRAHRLILTSLAQHGTLTTAQISKITGYSAKGSGFKNALSTCRTSGWIEGAGTGSSTITEAGLAALGTYEPLPTGQDLLRWWIDRGSPIGKAEAAILEVLSARHPEFVSTAMLAEATGYSAAGSGFKNAMSKLRTLGLAEGTGGLVLADELVGD